MAVDVTTTKFSNGTQVVESHPDASNFQVGPLGHLTVLGWNGEFTNVAVYRPEAWDTAKIVKAAATG